MIFLTLRNNRKLSHSRMENIRKTFFGLILAGTALLMIMGLDISVDQFKTIWTDYDIHYLTTLILSMISMPLTMFILLAMNKNEYGKKIFRYIFEIWYTFTCLALGAVFYLHIISLLWVQIALLLTSAIATFLSFILSRTHINYKATTAFGGLIVKPLSFDKKSKGVLGFAYLIIAFLFQAGNVVYFNYIDPTIDNYLPYQFLIQTASIVFYLLCIFIFSSSRSIGQSQEVLFYRYAQLLIMTLIFLVIGIGVYRVFIEVHSTREMIDDVSIGVNGIPLIILFIDLWINKRKLAKNRLYQGITELRLSIKMFAAIIFVLVNMIGAVEVKFFLTGEVQANIDVTLSGFAAILIIIAVPLFLFWRKITKRSSRILIILMLIIFAFIIYKFYFYADITNTGSEIFGLPIDSVYTMICLLGVLVGQVFAVIYQAKNSGRAFRHYGHINTKISRKSKNGKGGING